MTVTEVKAHVRAMKQRDGDVTPQSFRLSFAFPTQEMKENVEQALASASELTGSDKQGYLLDLICTDYLAGQLVEQGGDADSEVLATVQSHIANLERVYGVKLTVEEIDVEAVPNYTK